MGEAAERMQAAALMPDGDVGISLVAQAGIRAVAADVAVMSGYLSMSIPFLAAALAYGLSKATVLATSVLAVGQDAATSAAHEGTTGNLSLANTQWDTHRFASQEGRQLRTSMHVDTDRYTGYTGPGGLFTMTPDGTVVADMGSATSRVPAAGVRLSESLAVSHEERAAEARSMGRNWDVQAASARTAAATDATQLVERYSHDVSTGTAHSHGVAESESAEVRELASHVEKLAELGNLSKDQTMTLTGEASLGGGLPGFLRLGARGSATWRGQTVEHDAWNRMQEYDRQHGVTDLWSRVQEASRRYSTSTGDSELASLEESLGANLTRMQRFEDRAALSYGESEQWSEQAAAVRSDAQSIERELGQPFFTWLAERKGTDGRPIGAGGAMRIASPQTPEDAEALREHAAAFIAERFPAPAGPDPAAVAGRPAFEAARGDFEQAHGPAAGTAHAAWAAGVREHAAGAGAPGPGVANDSAGAGRGDVEAELAAREADRHTREGSVRSDIGAGRAAIATENVRPLREHATEGVPFVGEWLAGKLYGTARNSAPDAAEQRAEENPAERRSGPDWGGP